MRAVKDNLAAPLGGVNGKTRFVAGLLWSCKARPQKAEPDGLASPLCSQNAHDKAVVVRRAQGGTT